MVEKDEIGMGLKIDVDKVEFEKKRKLEGYKLSDMKKEEVGKIEGSEGRNVRDGNFGVKGKVNNFEEEMVERVEENNLDKVKVMKWRK